MTAAFRRSKRLIAGLLVLVVSTCLGQQKGPSMQPDDRGRACTFDYDRPNVPDCIRTDVFGKLTVSPNYLGDLRFDKHGLAALSAAGLGWAYVNRKGDVVVTGVAPFDNWADEFHDGLVRVLRDRRYGFANRTGKLVIPPKYDGAFQFERGTAVVCNRCQTQCDEDGEHCSFVGGQWSRINARGVVVATCRNDNCR
jgi:WG containing repeat